MNLKSSNKTDVNMTELVVEIDAESFEKAVSCLSASEEEYLYAGLP